MIDIIFYVFATITSFSALFMVISPNAVTGAFCMIIAFVSTAVLFILLEAYFLAIIQVLVYAGAVMVLFLFIIMLLDVDKDSYHFLKDKISLSASISGFALLVILVCGAFATGEHLPDPELLPVLENPSGESAYIPFTTSAKSFGYSLFTKYMLPFQLTGFLLLTAMIGVIVVSKKYNDD